VARYWKAIYVALDEDKAKAEEQLENLKQVIPSLEWDLGWEYDDEDDDDLDDDLDEDDPGDEVITCPVCEHANPWDLQNCQVCDANLRIETERESEGDES
jgi:hypothetical protein